MDILKFLKKDEEKVSSSSDFVVREYPRYAFLDFESGITADYWANLKKIERLNELESYAKRAEQKTRLANIRKKAQQIVKDSLRVSRNVTLVLSIVTTAHYEATHPDLKKESWPDGSVSYTHPDEETTHILNYLAGREQLTLKDGLSNFIEFTKNLKELKGVDIKIPDDIDNFTHEQMDEFWRDVCIKLGYTENNITFLKQVFDGHFFSKINVPPERADEIYNLVWKMEQECGNPNIRFMTSGPYGRATDMDRAYFDPRTNTIYIHMDKFIEAGEYGGHAEVLAEMSHSKHLGDRPIDFLFSAVMASGRILYSGGADPDNLSQAQQREYDREGSLEHEAHSKIEPELKKSYEDLLDLKGDNSKK